MSEPPFLGILCNLNPGHGGWLGCPVHGAEIRAQVQAMMKGPKAFCADCGMLYGGDDWLDMSLPHDQWEMISPRETGGGILCANCIVRRASKLPHVINVFARIAFADDHDEIARQFQPPAPQPAADHQCDPTKPCKPCGRHSTEPTGCWCQPIDYCESCGTRHTPTNDPGLCGAIPDFIGEDQ